MLAPRHGAAGIVGLLNGDVGHEAIRRGPVPVLLVGLEEDTVTGADDLDLAAAALAEPQALNDTDRLPASPTMPAASRGRRSGLAALGQSSTGR